MDSKEWDNISQFLRLIYGVSDDMKSIAAGFTDSEKKKKGSDLVESVRKLSRAADVPVNDRNGPEFLAICKKIDSAFDDFFDLLRDVPDEI
jgi:hypothetical protein